MVYVKRQDASEGSRATIDHREVEMATESPPEAPENRSKCHNIPFTSCVSCSGLDIS